MTLWSVASPGHVLSLVTLMLVLDIVDAAERFPPSITFPTRPMEKVMLPDHTEETITCRASGYPPPSYAWYHNGVLVEENSNNVKSFPTGELVLIQFVTTSNGDYVCMAMNALGTAVSQRIRILAFYFPSDPSPREFYRLLLYQSFSISCHRVLKTVPEMDRKWFYNKLIPVRYNRRIGMDQKGTLHAAYSTHEDAGRVYKCGLIPRRSDITQRNYYEQGEISLMLTQKPASKNVRPELMYATKPAKAHIGQNAVIECFFASDPAAVIRWKTHRGKTVPLGDKRLSVNDFGRKLVIQKVTQEDEGVYTCTGFNGYGGITVDIFVNVTAPPLPVETTTLTSQTVPARTEVVLQCKARPAEGELLNRPQWYRNGHALETANLPDQSRYSFSPDMVSLTITHLNKTVDTACFQCNVSNSEGYLFFDSYLRVINSIQVTKSPPYLITMVPGDVIDVEIRAKGDDCCELKMLWQHYMQPIRPEEWPAFETDSKSGQILFNSNLVSGHQLANYTGVYAVRVSNKYQTLVVAFEIRLTRQNDDQLQMRQREPIKERSEREYESWALCPKLWIGLTLIAPALAVCALFLCYERTKRRRKKSNNTSDTPNDTPGDMGSKTLEPMAQSTAGGNIVESSVDAPRDMGSKTLEPMAQSTAGSNIAESSVDTPVFNAPTRSLTS